MYFIDTVRLLLRRWLIVVTGLILMAGAAAACLLYVPTQYQASGQLLLLLPVEATGADTPTNPYLNLQDGLTTTASLIAGTLMTADTERNLKGKGFTSEYDVSVLPGAGPLLVITTKDTDAGKALATRNEVANRLNNELNQIQEQVNVPRRQFIHASPSSVGTTAEPLPGSKIRALAVVLAVGSTLTLIAAFVRDRRKSRPRGGAPSKRGTDPTPGEGVQPGARAAAGAASPSQKEAAKKVAVKQLPSAGRR